MIIFLLTYLIISNAATTKKEKSILYSRSVILGITYASFLTYNNLYAIPLEKSISLFGGFFNLSIFSQSFNILIYVISGLIIVLTAFYARKIINLDEENNKSIVESFILFFKPHGNKQKWDILSKLIINVKSNQFEIMEYPLVIAFIVCGAILLIGTGDLISMFLTIELQSYGLYILSTLYKDSESATGSGLTYFLLGGLSSCFILLGSALLYVNSGTTNLDNLYVMSTLSGLTNEPIYWYHSSYIHFSLIILSVGLLFKVSAAPFHFWSPDVYDGIPTIVTTFVANIAKISIFALLLEIVLYTDHKDIKINLYGFVIESLNWKNILIISSLTSLVVGSVLGLTQYRIKRLLAYSTISHVGFILLSLSICTVESTQAYIFYILQYIISNVNIFFIIITIGFTLYLYKYTAKDEIKKEEKEKLIDIENSPIQLTDQLKGFFYINSFLSISLIITLFSFVGIPPLIGFFAKQMVLSAALDKGYIFMTLLGVVTSVIGAVYYLNIVKLVFFEKSNYNLNNLFNLEAEIKDKVISNNSDINSNISIAVNGVLSTSISILTMLIMFFMFMPSFYFNSIGVLSLTLFKT